MRKEIALLILNYNGEGWIEECLRSVAGQSDKDFETYFIDQGSTDNSVKIARKTVPGVKIIQVGKNLGYTAGSNYGFEYLDKKGWEYKYYLLAGNDAILAKDLVKELKKIIKESKGEFGVVEPALVTREMVVDLCGGKLSLLTGRCNGYLHGKKYEKSRDIFQTFWGCTACALVRKDVLKAADYNDDYYGYFDDISMCWKFNNMGYKCLSTLRTYVIHLGSMTFKKMSEQKMYLLERNRIFTFWQNLSLLAFIILIPIVVIFRLGAIGLLLGLGRIDFKLFLAGIRGIIDGFRCLGRYKRYNGSIFRDIKTFLRAERVIKWQK